MTGAAVGTIFHHFKNKEDLFCHVLKDVQDNILSAFEQHKKETSYTKGIDRVLGATACYLHLSGEMQDQFLMLHRHYPYQMAETNPVCRTYLESIYNCLLDILEGGIAAGIEDGSIQSGSPRNTAMVLFAMVDGVARFNTYSLYHAGSLYKDLMNACRSILTHDTEPGV